MKSQGLTLLEVLIAIVLLGILVVLTAQPLLFSLRTSGTSDKTLSATRAAQSILEQARAQVINNYSSPDFTKVTDTFKDIAGTSVSLVCQNLSLDGTASSGDPTVSAGCSPSSNGGASPNMRRLTVTATVQNQPNVVLTLDVRP